MPLSSETNSVPDINMTNRLSIIYLVSYFGKNNNNNLQIDSWSYQFSLNSRLVDGKVYFHPPGQFLALNGRMGYKILQGDKELSNYDKIAFMST